MRENAQPQDRGEKTQRERLRENAQPQDWRENAQPRDWRENAQPRDWGGLEQLNLRGET